MHEEQSHKPRKQASSIKHLTGNAVANSSNSSHNDFNQRIEESKNRSQFRTKKFMSQPVTTLNIVDNFVTSSA